MIMVMDPVLDPVPAIMRDQIMTMTLPSPDQAQVPF